MSFSAKIEGHGATPQEANSNLRKMAQHMLGQAAVVQADSPAAPSAAGPSGAKAAAAGKAAAKTAAAVNRLEEIQTRMKALAEAYAAGGQYKKPAEAGAAVRAEVFTPFKVTKAAELDVSVHAAVCAVLDGLEAKLAEEPAADEQF